MPLVAQVEIVGAHEGLYKAMPNGLVVVTHDPTVTRRTPAMKARTSVTG